MRASCLGPNKRRGNKFGQRNRALEKFIGPKAAVRSALGPPANSFWPTPGHFKWENGWPPFFCFRSESGFTVFGSSPVQPFCSGILKPNTEKDNNPAPCLGEGGWFFTEMGPGARNSTVETPAGTLVNRFWLLDPGGGFRSKTAGMLPLQK